MTEFREIEVVRPADDATLWRYMDLGKYISLLMSRSLYLCPLSALDDPFEGTSPTSLGMTAVLNSQVAAGRLNEQQAAEISVLSRNSASVFKGRIYVNCWHMSEYESDAMWKLYSSSAESICVKTQAGVLASQLPEDAEIGKVMYLDFNNFEAPELPLGYTPAFMKRQSFEHEKEVRIFLTDFPRQGASTEFLQELSKPNKAGKMLEVNVDELVQGVLINPLSPEWFVDVVQDVTTKYGLNVKISQSKLAQLPTY